MIFSCPTDNHPQDMMLGSYQEQILPSEVMRSGVGYKGRKRSFEGNTLRQKMEALCLVSIKKKQA